MKPRQYIIYDGRAILGDTDSAAVMCLEDTLKQAKRTAREFGETAICSYAVDENNVLTDERMECATDPQGRVIR